MKPLIMWLAMVFVLSVYPRAGMGRYYFPHADKVLHFIIYAITAALLYKVLRGSGRAMFRKWALVLAFALASLYGLGMEFAQEFTGMRSFSVWDEAVNVAGALSALLLIKLKERKNET